MQKTVPDPTSPDLDEVYAETVRRWLALEDPASISGVYEAEVFPLARARMQRSALAHLPRRLLILPVGTQPYSPLLVAEGVPANTVGLLATPASLDIARDLEDLLEGRGCATDLRVLASHGVSREEVAELAVAIYRTAGEPDPRATVVDITSGRKPTVAALASVADALGATTCYLEARFHRHPHGGYATDERLILGAPLSLSAVHPAMEAPRALAAHGLFREAARHLDRQGRQRYLPPAVRAARHLFVMCDALLQEAPQRAARALRRALREAPEGSGLRVVLAEAWETWGLDAAAGETGILAPALQELRRALPSRTRDRVMGGVGARGYRRPILRRLMEWLLHGAEA